MSAHIGQCTNTTYAAGRCALTAGHTGPCAGIDIFKTAPEGPQDPFPQPTLAEALHDRSQLITETFIAHMQRIEHGCPFLAPSAISWIANNTHIDLVAKIPLNWQPDRQPAAGNWLTGSYTIGGHGRQA